jgi:glycine cleavage system transcriptional repressor
MTQHVVLTAVGADRPGLVDEVASFVVERGGNVADSRMINLHGQFAMVMLVGGSDETMARLRAELESLATSCAVHAEITPADESRLPVAAALPYKLQTWAMDHPGLLKSMSHLLGELQINIESADTRLREAPVTGTPLFEMELVLAVPADTPIAALRESLGRLCDELNMDWRLEAL